MEKVTTKRKRGGPKKIDYSIPIEPGKVRIKEKYRQWFKEHHKIHGDIKSVRIDDKNVEYILRKANNNNNMT